MITMNQIKDHLTSYITDEESFSAFQSWLVDYSWDMHKDSSADAQKLAHELNELIYDYLDEYIDETTLKAQLAPFVTRHVFRRTYATAPTAIVNLAWIPEKQSEGQTVVFESQL